MTDAIYLTKILVGNEYGAEHIDAAIGKTIHGIALADDVLHLDFTDGYRLKISDEGQSCCESRYMTTSDCLNEYVGATLISVSVLDGPSFTGTDDQHEVQFLRITTSKGDITFETHNEHNGYYGGFDINAQGEMK
jgi:hypothetical protein